MVTNQKINVFIGSTIKSREDDLVAVREILKQWATVDEGIDDTTDLGNRGSKLLEAIKKADFFIGIYASKMPQEPLSSWSEELSLARNFKSAENLLIFIMKSNFEDDTLDPIWQKLEESGHYIQKVSGREALLLHIIQALEKRTESKHISRGEIILPRIFNLGPTPYWLVYGRRSDKPRKTYGSLQTIKHYFKTFQRIQNTLPEVAVEPDTTRQIFEQNGTVLLSGPPTSNWSKDYFAQLRNRGIQLFSGSCQNHIGEICSHKGAHCKSGRDRGATGCAFVNDEERVYSFRDSDPSVHVAMLARTPSPWSEFNFYGSGNPFPFVLYASGCHSQAGPLSYHCIADEKFMCELLSKIRWTPDIKKPPNFVAIISQKDEEEPLIEFAGLVRTKNEENWYLEDKYKKGDFFEPALSAHPYWGNVFVSYSHKDKGWMELLRDMLSPLIDAEKISFWSDEKIAPGQEWEKEIDKSMKSAKVAVLLVSLNYLKSDFIKDKELPYLLMAAEKEQVKLFWILVSNCLWEQTPLVKYQAANDTNRPLDTIQNKGEASSVVKEICEILAKVVKGNGDH